MGSYIQEGIEGLLLLNLWGMKTNLIKIKSTLLDKLSWEVNL